jgi:gas vesicle structural protein
MAVQLASRPNFIDVLDRVLDKGIVIDAWMRVGLVGLDLRLVEIESRMVVVSIDTYLKYPHPLTAIRVRPCARELVW